MPDRRGARRTVLSSQLGSRLNFRMHISWQQIASVRSGDQNGWPWSTMPAWPGMFRVGLKSFRYIPFGRKRTLTDETTNTVELATELTMAWLSNPNTRTSAEDVPAFLKSMHDAVIGLSTMPVDAPTDEAAAEFTRAVTARKSLANPDVIISMIDGKPYKTLTRHLSTHGLTPAEYRARYSLKADYPMTAPSYSAMRRDMAKKIGLGRKPGQKASVKAENLASAPKRGRPAKVVEPT